MKKAIIISLVSLFVVNSLDLHEWMKLPMLVHHFFEHQSENKNETFFDFISQHYAANYSHQDPHNHHNDLPFKSGNCTSFHSTIAFYHHIVKAYCSPILQLCLLKYNFHQAFFISVFTGKIWQPPKL